ncbi:LysE family translocator [Psychroflexus aestuariivivens]|uniref:LysE family translocator n=1 Tax=Psychroflexus aestuariivivens TaxID=1795040 RepID=UPI000FD9149D|nr:LysE family transporter [Psychroflexus aestuariivivens]
MDEAQIYLLTFAAAFAGVIPPGLVNMSVAKACIEKGRKNGLMMAVGATIIVFLQAFLAVLLAKYIFSHPYVKTMLLRTGVVILLLLMIYFLLSAHRKQTHKTIKKKTSAKSFFSGMLISALNVFPIPYFVLISTLLSTKYQLSFSLVHDVCFAISAALGTFMTLYLYVLFFMRIQTKTAVFKKYSNYFMALLMLVLIIIALFRIN